MKIKCDIHSIKHCEAIIETILDNYEETFRKTVHCLREEVKNDTPPYYQLFLLLKKIHKHISYTTLEVMEGVSENSQIRMTMEKETKNGVSDEDIPY